MSKIKVTLKKEILTIEKKNSRKSDEYIENIPLDTMEYGKDYKSNITVTNQDERNKVLFIKRLKNDKTKETLEDEEESYSNNVIVVYSRENEIRYSYCSEETAYKRIIKLRYKVLGISLNKRRLKIRVLAYLVNPYKLDIKHTKFYIDEVLGKECNLKQYKTQLSKLQMLEGHNIYTFKFKMKDIIKDESVINGAIRFGINIDGNEIGYRIGILKPNIKNPQHYYAPIKSVYTKDFAVHIRRTIKGNLTLVKRRKEPIENTLKFRILESKFISGLFYNISKILVPKRKNKINIFYEKFASKAEEGTYDLFLLMQKNKRGKNYFIISEDSPDYEKIKENKNVVKKYSLKYYWLIYNANNFISTEASIHLNILRSNNSALRKSLTDKKFIFLQHGVTYMKAQGKNSTFSKGKEGEVSYIVAGSEKEKDIIADMLGIYEQQVLKTGLPIFSRVKYNHINDKSDNIVTIMLTWKPYEEQLYNFEESTYYKNTMDIYNMLTKYIDKEKIIIVPHPKVYDLLKETDIKENIWLGKISEVLEKTKLLITDYSSVCYNSFYQGAGVIFYQEDLEKYEAENGKLIPNDDEYIGRRAFNLKELKSIIKETIENNNIKLDKVRTKEFENNYKTINEFTDGKNIDRIYEKLVELKLV